MLNPKLVPMNALVNLTDPTTPCFFISSPVDGSAYFPVVRMDGWESAQEDLLSPGEQAVLIIVGTLYVPLVIFGLVLVLRLVASPRMYHKTHNWVVAVLLVFTAGKNLV